MSAASSDILIKDISDYSDKNGNSVVCKSENVLIHLSIYACDCSVDIGNVQVGGVLEIYVRGDSNNVVISDNCGFPSRSVIMMHGGRLYISDGCTFGTGLLIMVHKHCEITLGKDCMASYDLNLMAGDGHNIYDINTEKIINVKTVGNEVFCGSIDIGNHVWFGLGCKVIGGIGETVIGDGSIIGAGAVVKGSYPNNVIIAGSPSEVIRENVRWER